MGAQRLARKKVVGLFGGWLAMTEGVSCTYWPTPVQWFPLEAWLAQQRWMSGFARLTSMSGVRDIMVRRSGKGGAVQVTHKRSMGGMN